MVPTSSMAPSRRSGQAENSLSEELDHNGSFSMQIINVCGLKGKLDIPEFKNNLRLFDISLLCETKLDKMDENYIIDIITPLRLKAFFKHRKTLSTWRSGGLCILYKEHMEKYIKHINSNCKLVQWLLISKLLIGTDKDVLVGSFSWKYLCTT